MTDTLTGDAQAPAEGGRRRRGNGLDSMVLPELKQLASTLGLKGANIINLAQVHRDGSFHTFHVDMEVHDLAHLHAIIAALRAADQVSSAERI